MVSQGRVQPTVLEPSAEHHSAPSWGLAGNVLGGLFITRGSGALMSIDCGVFNHIFL